MSGEFTNLTILVVEDNDSNIMFFKSALKRTGASIIIAVNGEQAIESVKKDPLIDVILMDINLPKMDGLKATTEIKKLYPNIPIIIQTAYVQNFTVKQCFEAGADSFIEKPIRLSVLFETIQKFVNKN